MKYVEQLKQGHHSISYSNSVRTGGYMKYVEQLKQGHHSNCHLIAIP